MEAAENPHPTSQTFYFASVGRRFVALFIDSIIISIISAIFTAMGSFSSQDVSDTMTTAMLLSNLIKLLIGAAYAIFFIGHYGQTPGKMIMNVKVVNYDGTKPTYATAVVRYIMSIISGAVILIGYIWAFFNKEHQTWHDMVAKTYVVKA